MFAKGCKQATFDEGWIELDNQADQIDERDVSPGPMSSAPQLHQFTIAQITGKSYFFAVKKPSMDPMAIWV